jgi:prolyl-tRNA synthetase
MFTDMELIGVPHRIVIGERGLKDGNVEYQGRRDEKSSPIPLSLPHIIELLKSKLSG